METLKPSAWNQNRQKHLPPLPPDLGGYQALEDPTVVVRDGDLIKACSSHWSWADVETGGTLGEALARDNKAVYRKIPVPHCGDLDINPTTGNPYGETVTGIEITETSAALTYDEGKPPLADLGTSFTELMAQVLAKAGSSKYPRDNWRKGMEVRRNLSCALRHINKFLEGQDLDDETGLSHLGHAGCRLMFVTQNMTDGVAVDDRYIP